MKYYFRCPQCGNDDEFVRPKELFDSSWPFGGLTSNLSYQDYLRHRVQCTKCSHIFRQPRLPNSPLAIFTAWIVGIMIVALFVATLFFTNSEASGLLPTNDLIDAIEKMIAAQPRVAAYFFLTSFGLIALSCVITGFISNARFQRAFARQHRVKPLPPPPPSRPPPAKPPLPEPYLRGRND